MSRILDLWINRKGLSEVNDSCVLYVSGVAGSTVTASSSRDVRVWFRPEYCFHFPRFFPAGSLLIPLGSRWKAPEWSRVPFGSGWIRARKKFMMWLSIGGRRTLISGSHVEDSQYGVPILIDWKSATLRTRKIDFHFKSNGLGRRSLT
jgi:hypothetical protein